MFLGHVAVALAAKPLAPRASLGTLTFAALWIDLLWPILQLTLAPYSVAFATGALTRRPVPAILLALGVALLLYFAPLVVPGFEWMNLFEFRGHSYMTAQEYVTKKMADFKGLAYGLALCLW